ncbi:hypothetical protein GCM10017673_51280 [Streptosporangium violaceochromogenes]|nr:hypothetical protein GCM10017673_51280 [Streptosporangium violaceochromogenes]
MFARLRARSASALLGRRLPLAVLLVTQALFSLWWAAFYPGLMSYDSISYVWHVTTGHWMANHSVAYDGLVWLSLRLTGDLGALTLAQTAAMSATLAYAACALRDLGARPIAAGVAAVAIPVIPATGSFVVTIWKDVPFTVCAVLASATLARLVARRTTAAVTLLGAELCGMVIFRNNGFLFVAIAAPIIVGLLPGIRRRLLVATGTPLLVAFTLTGAVFPALGIPGAPPSLTYATAYGDVAVAFKRARSSFTPRDTEVMARVAPLSHWRRSADCHTTDPTTQRPGFAAAADTQNAELVALWGRVVRRTPALVAAVRLCRGAIAWDIAGGPGLSARTAIHGVGVPDDLFGWARWNAEMRVSPYRPILAPRPLSAPLREAVTAFREASRAPWLEWLLWRGAFWCYLAYAVVLAGVRRHRAVPVVAALVLGQQLGVLLANPAQLYRYMVAPTVVSVLLLALVPARGGRRPYGGPGRTPGSPGRDAARRGGPRGAEGGVSRGGGAGTRATV